MTYNKLYSIALITGPDLWDVEITKEGLTASEVQNAVDNAEHPEKCIIVDLLGKRDIPMTEWENHRQNQLSDSGPLLRSWVIVIDGLVLGNQKGYRSIWNDRKPVGSFEMQRKNGYPTGIPLHFKASRNTPLHLKKYDGRACGIASLLSDAPSVSPCYPKGTGSITLSCDGHNLY